jgi:hypothetical protein
MAIIDTLANIVQILAIALLYFVIGFGPGFILGLLIVNRIFGKNLPLRMDKHASNMQKASEHNSQWHPDNPKWK